MRIALLALLVVTGCAGSAPGRVLEDWERAADVSSSSAAPQEVPAGLDWQAVTDPKLLVARDDAGVIWMRARPSCERGWRDPVVFVPKTYVALDAYVHGRRRGPRHSYRYASGTPWYAFPIDCPVSAPIVFRIESRYTQIGFPEPPVVGERAALIGHLVVRDAARIVLGVSFLLVGLVAGLLSLGRRERRAMIGLATFGWGLASWTLFHTRTKQLWLPTMELWFAAWWISVPMIGFGAALFVEAFFGTGPRRLLHWLTVGMGGVTVAAALSLALHGDAFRSAATLIFITGRLLIVLGALLVVVRLGRLARTGNREAALLLAGFAFAFVAVFRDVALSLGWVEGGDTWTQYGYAIFGLTLVLLVRRRVVLLQRHLVAHADALERYLRERDLLMRDLHDGLGGIVTNMRMLAERGIDDGGSSGVLHAISKLAAEGVTELRTLIFGFDGPPQTWRQVAGELRLAGTNAVEAFGVEHHFERAIATAAPPPDLSLVVHIMRIHREAITNALKHARPSRLFVRLDVAATHLELVVADDGRGRDADTSANAGVGLAKGLRSMRSRARELGGALAIDEDEGTRIHLSVPLQNGPPPKIPNR